MSIHTVSNNFLSISVNTLGAELCSLRTGKTELLWQSDKAVWARYAPVLFPIVGRLKSDAFSYGDSDYKMSQHGFARDKEFMPVQKTENTLEFELTANEESLDVFPFHFSLRIRYELQEDELRISYSVFNPDNKPLLFSIGAHPGFNCKRKEGESLDDFYLDFENKNELTATRLKDGLLDKDTYTIKLINGKLKLNAGLFDNDALVFKNSQIEKVTLLSEKTPFKITMLCKSWPYFGIWTKKGSDAFVCLEPWHGITDKTDHDGKLGSKEGLIKLEPHKSIGFNFSLVVKAD